jgi:methionyl-tRNA formyltransferase
MQQARVVYAGTPEFAVPALQALLDLGIRPVAVYTQPDRPAGRGRQLLASAIKQFAVEQNLPVEQPESFKQPDVIAALAAYRPDIIIVTAYGLLLPQSILALPRLGCINIHASLLPRWRGAAPIQRAILAGDRETGVCLMQMETGLDTGPVLATSRLSIEPDQTAGELHDSLSRLGAELLAQQFPALIAGTLTPTPQEHASATYAKKLDKSEAWLDWSQPAEFLHRQIRAFNPWPVAQTHMAETVLRIWRARIAAATGGKPGAVIQADTGGIRIATGDGALDILELQRPGGKPLAAAEFINAVNLRGVQFS